MVSIPDTALISFGNALIYIYKPIPRREMGTWKDDETFVLVIAVCPHCDHKRYTVQFWTLEMIISFGKLCNIYLCGFLQVILYSLTFRVIIFLN